MTFSHSGGDRPGISPEFPVNQSVRTTNWTPITVSPNDSDLVHFGQRVFPGFAD